MLATCIDLTGCMPRPRLLVCARHATTVLDVPDRVLALGNWVFGYRPDDPFKGKECIWSFLRPSAPLQAAVEVSRNRLPEQYLGVHLRAPNGYKECPDKLRQFWAQCQQVSAVPKDAELACEMPTEYINRFREPGATFLLGTDGDNAALKERLIKEGGLIPRTEGLQEPLKTVADLLLHMWMFVGAKTFLGNPLSTLSSNVCNIRRSLGRPCPNLPTLGTEQCFERDQYIPYLDMWVCPVLWRWSR